MARTIKEIANGMKVEFVHNETLCNAFGLTYDQNRDNEECVSYYNQNFSAVSVETCLIYIVAACAAALENMFDWFKQDVNEIVANERYGHKGWYEAKAREFHYTDPNTQEEVYPITHASCEELNFGIKLKVAKGEPGSMESLSADNPNNELLAFRTYMNRLKPAGMPIVFVNEPADELSLNMVVYYNPIKHTNANNVLQTVKDAITAYLQDIDFNGVFTTTALVDALQKVDGLDIIEVLDVQARHGQNNFERIELSTRYQPESGYLRLAGDEHVTINITPNTLL